MYVHVVQSGETLTAIGRKYQISVEQLKRVNGLDLPNLVRGLALLISSYTYIVQPGDTLAGIASKAYVPLEQLRSDNPGISDAGLHAGMRIRIPDISKNYIAGTLGFYAIRRPDLDQQLINDFAPYSSSLSIFEYHFASNGEIANELNDVTAIQTTWRNRVTPLVTITNITSGGFDPNLLHQVLSSPSSRTNLINQIYDLVKRKGYGGVNIDFEQVMAEDRDLFSGFLRQLRDRLREGKFGLVVSVPPKSSDELPWFMGYDYGGIGSVADYIFIMAYNWHYGGSQPGPVAPITEIRKTVDFALRFIPQKKIILGVPLYGFNWVVPHVAGRTAPAISNQDAVQTAIRYQSPIHYSSEYESPFFRYTDEQGRVHEVWFEDVRSMATKMAFVRQYGLQAIGAWQLTLGFVQGPWLLRKFFTIRKL
jgi:spore germination protein YaaH